MKTLYQSTLAIKQQYIKRYQENSKLKKKKKTNKKNSYQKFLENKKLR